MVLNMVEHDLYLIHSFKSWFNVMYLENCGFIIRFFSFFQQKTQQISSVFKYPNAETPFLTFSNNIS